MSLSTYESPQPFGYGFRINTSKQKRLPRLSNRLWRQLAYHSNWNTYQYVGEQLAEVGIPVSDMPHITSNWIRLQGGQTKRFC
jgi:hypothetical protein